MPERNPLVDAQYTTAEMMAVAAARALDNRDVCFVGIGAPSLACNLARLTHAPDITLITSWEPSAPGPTCCPSRLATPSFARRPSSPSLCPRCLQYWLQGGRISVGFLGGAQIDRFANINSSVIGPYDHPKVRLPGGGGAPEIASLCRQTYVVMAQSRRSFVERVDFITSFGFGEGGDHRERLGISTAGPALVVTDLCIMRPDPQSRELTVTSMHPGVTREQIADNTGWDVRFADALKTTHAPTDEELTTLRDLQARTERAGLHQTDRA